MKTQLRRKIIKTLLALTIGLSPLMIYAPAYAASASLYLSPSSSSTAQGSYLTVSIRENSGSEAVNAAQVNLSYSSGLLSFVSISSSSAFSIVAQNSGGGGSVSIGRGAIPAVTGVQTIASVRFKALANTGKATITINSSSSVVSANSNTNIATSFIGGNYTLINPPPAPVAPPKDTTPPSITNVKISNVTVTTAVVSWSSSEPASSEVDYGINKSYGLTAVDTNLVTEHKITLNSPTITPATTYHYVVKNVDSSGNASSSADNVFNTSGASLRIKVLDQNKKTVKGAQVSIDTKSSTTDNKGQVVLSDLSLGRKTIVITYKNQKFTDSVNISTANPATPQEVSVVIKTATNSFWVPVLFMAAGAFIAYLLWQKFKGKGSGGSSIFNKLVGRISKNDSKVMTKSNQDGPKIIKPTTSIR